MQRSVIEMRRILDLPPEAIHKRPAQADRLERLARLQRPRQRDQLEWRRRHKTYQITRIMLSEYTLPAPPRPIARTLTRATVAYQRLTGTIGGRRSDTGRRAMRCSACGTENPPQAKFCLECATPLARRCLRCGTALPDAARFCMECAQPVSAPGAARRIRRLAPSAYTPRHLAEKILAGRAALEGERKQVTVLFADVVGSTELIQDLDPEEAQGAARAGRPAR